MRKRMKFARCEQANAPADACISLLKNTPCFDLALSMADKPDNDLSLELQFLPDWVKDGAGSNKYAGHSGEDRQSRDRRGFGREGRRPPRGVDRRNRSRQGEGRKKEFREKGFLLGKRILTNREIDELRSACAVFGITDVRIIGTTEPFRIYQSPELITKLRDVILEIRPQILITQSPYAPTRHGLQNNSPDDHTEVAHATLEARNLASTPIYGSNIQPHKIAATYFPGVYFEKDQFDFYVDATNWFEKRVEAENAFKSQGHTEEFSRRRIELTLGDTGWFSGTMYAESFVREKAEVVSKITISEHTLKRSKEPPSTHMRRISGLEH